MKKIKAAPRTMVKNPDRPVCPKHNSSMVFDRSDTTWKCGVDGCRVVARRRDENSVPEKPKSRIRTQLEILTDQDGEDSYRIVAWHDDAPRTLDVTDHIEMIIDEQTNSVTLCLLFHDVKRIYL